MSVTELKNRISHYLRMVKRGEVLEVVERDQPVARLERIERSQSSAKDWLEGLTREGLVARARTTPYTAFLDKPPTPCTGDAGAALRAERNKR